jgi:hypothetical protein
MENTQITIAPVVVNGMGVTSAERKLNVAVHATNAAQLALVNAGGKVGKAVRVGAAMQGFNAIAFAAFNANYRPLAEYIAAQTGEPVVISGRESFESLPDRFEERIQKIRNAKNGGYRTNKDGVQVPTAALSLYLGLKSDIVDCLSKVAAAHAKRKADSEAKAAELTTQ